MLVPLVILAALSVCGGWIGSERFEKFLSPVFHHTEFTVVTGPTESAPPTPASSQEGASETVFTLISVGAALLGFFLAWQLYHRRPKLPQQIAHALGGFYETVLNKYWVDELYAVLFVKPLVDGSTRILWRGVDQGVIDATLDNSANGAREVSDAVRHMQSGTQYGPRFYRMWKYYIMGSAGAFRARKLQLWQIVLSKGDIPSYTTVR